MGAVGAVVRAAVAAVRRGGELSAEALGDAVEGPAGALTRRATAGALAQPRPVGDTEALRAALAARPAGPMLGGASAAALAARMARRVRPLGFLARRSPVWLVASAVPATYASVARGAEEVGLLASHLAQRAREAGVEPDPERVRRVAVQLASGALPDPRSDPRHAPLVVAWMRRALQATLPFSAGVATRDPGALAAAAGRVAPGDLSSAGPPAS